MEYDDNGKLFLVILSKLTKKRNESSGKTA